MASRRSVRLAEGCLIAEGAKLIDVALDAGARVESLYLDPDLLHPGDGAADVVDRAASSGTPVFELAPGVLPRVVDTVTPQPLVAVVAAVDVSLDQLAGRRPDLIVVCVDVRDPGNAGAIVRASEAAGASGLVSCVGSADLSNPKAVRASAGSVFHVPIVVGGHPEEVLEEVARWGLQTLGTEARGGVDYAAVDLTGPIAVVLGNEAHGLPDSLRATLDAHVSIPMAGRAESLNVGMAAAVVCFEAARQRRVGSMP